MWPEGKKTLPFNTKYYDIKEEIFIIEFLMIDKYNFESIVSNNSE